MKVLMKHQFKKLQVGKVAEVDEELGTWLVDRRYADPFSAPAKPAKEKDKK